MNSFNELCKKISQDIDTKDTRARARTEQEQIRIEKSNLLICHQLVKHWILFEVMYFTNSI